MPKSRAVSLRSALDGDVRARHASQRLNARMSTDATSGVALRHLSSLTMERSMFGMATGLQFDGARDIYDALGYPRKLGMKEYRETYKRGGIAKRIIEAFPRATWSGGATIIEDETLNSETEFEKAARLFFQRKKLWTYILRADILANIGYYSVLVLGAPGDFKSPLKRAKDIAYFTAVAEDRAMASKFIDDIHNPRFGMPEHYTVSIGSREKGRAGTLRSAQLHHSRAIHFAEGCLEDDVYGTPRLEAVYNYLLDLDKNIGGGSEAAWKRMDPGIIAEIDPTLDYSDDDYDKLDDEIEEFQHGYRRFLTTHGAKINTQSVNVTSFGPNVDTVLRLISATFGIPFRILIGSERGELASTQDRNNWADRIAERREEYAIPAVRSLIDRLIELGVLPTPKDGEYQVVWPNVSALDQLSKAEVIAKLTKANRDQATVSGRVLITTNEIRRDILNLGPIEDQKDSEAIKQEVGVPGRGKASIPGARTTDVGKDTSAPGEPIAGEDDE